jgi:hypothetical protein
MTVVTRRYLASTFASSTSSSPSHSSSSAGMSSSLRGLWSEWGSGVRRAARPHNQHSSHQPVHYMYALLHSGDHSGLRPARTGVDNDQACADTLHEGRLRAGRAPNIGRRGAVEQLIGRFRERDAASPAELVGAGRRGVDDVSAA